jgi:hypothetical protein
MRASMPAILSGNTNAALIMSAKKGADVISAEAKSGAEWQGHVSDVKFYEINTELNVSSRYTKAD